MNNQYMPKYVKVKQIKRSNGDVCYLEKDHVNAIEDTLLYERKLIGKRMEEVGTELTTILQHISDDAGGGGGSSKIESISRNGTKLPIDSEKNVNVVVPTSLSELTEDDNHKSFTNVEKEKLAGLSNYNDTPVKHRISMLENTIVDKVEKTTTIAGIDLQDNITKDELKDALEITESDPVFTSWKNGKTIVAGENTSGTEGCIAIGLGAKTEDWGTAVGVNSFARCGLALGPDSKAGSSGDAENLAAIAIGRYSQATKKNSISIGGNDPNNTAKANAVAAVQIGIGTNNDENTLQFQNTKVVVNGKIPDASLQTNPSTKVDKTTTIAGVDLQDNITKDELKTALGTQDLTFTFADSTTKTFRFVCEEVTA